MLILILKISLVFFFFFARSVYEVYVKDDGENQDGKSDVSGDSSDPPDYEFINVIN